MSQFIEFRLTPSEVSALDERIAKLVDRIEGPAIEGDDFRAWITSLNAEMLSISASDRREFEQEFARRYPEFAEETLRRLAAGEFDPDPVAAVVVRAIERTLGQTIDEWRFQMNRATERRLADALLRGGLGEIKGSMTFEDGTRGVAVEFPPGAVMAVIESDLAIAKARGDAE